MILSYSNPKPRWDNPPIQDPLGDNCLDTSWPAFSHQIPIPDYGLSLPSLWIPMLQNEKLYAMSFPASLYPPTSLIDLTAASLPFRSGLIL